MTAPTLAALQYPSDTISDVLHMQHLEVRVFRRTSSSLPPVRLSCCLPIYRHEQFGSQQTRRPFILQLPLR
jgi:hypothetical protein